MRIWRLVAIASASSSLYLAPFASAQQKEPKPLVITAENLMASDARHAALEAEGGDRNAVLPGDVVLYRLTFTNTADVPVRAVELKDPLPAGLRYVTGTATADREDVAVAYSIDGGLTYSAQPMIETMENGRRVERPAPPELFTHIRWIVGGWVEPGAQVVAEFRAQLPAAKAHEEPGVPN